jgi:hypothetical protein
LYVYFTRRIDKRAEADNTIVWGPIYCFVPVETRLWDKRRTSRWLRNTLAPYQKSQRSPHSFSQSLTFIQQSLLYLINHLVFFCNCETNLVYFRCMLWISLVLSKLWFMKIAVHQPRIEFTYHT